jgi:hypothetical protein
MAEPLRLPNEVLVLSTEEPFNPDELFSAPRFVRNVKKLIKIEPAIC